MSANGCASTQRGRMNNASTFDRLVLCGLALLVIVSFLNSCTARAVTAVASRIVQTTMKTSGPLARIVMNGARAALGAMTQPFCKDRENLSDATTSSHHG